MFKELSGWLFDPSGLTPHGFCLLWEPGLIWTYALSDAGIALAYFSIPVALGVIARRRRDLVFRPLLFLFAAFILLCGATHWIDVLTLWVPVYGLAAVVKVATALVSLFTAIVLWRFIPAALALPSPSQFREANAALRATEERLIQSQKMEVVGQLTGGIAHDFNNMIQAVSGGLTLLERRIAGRAARRGRAVRRRDAPRAEQRRRPDEPASGVLPPAGAAARARRSPTSSSPGCASFSSERSVPRSSLSLLLGDGKWDITCDAHQLEGALMNLAINARDAMPDGGELTISVTDRKVTAARLRRSGGSQTRRLRRNLGLGYRRRHDPGNPRRALSLSTPPNRTGQGTGLGLSQVYGFVRQSGGFLRIESEPGRGTDRPHLPAGLSPVAGGEARTGRKPAGASTTPSSARGVVLVVEDQADVRAQIVEVLAEHGMPGHRRPWTGMRDCVSSIRRVIWTFWSPTSGFLA